jgi:hypothetical protein
MTQSVPAGNALADSLIARPPFGDGGSRVWGGGQGRPLANTLGDRHRSVEGPSGAVGPLPVQSSAALCSPLQRSRRK